MTVFKDIVSGRKYTDRNGQEKTQWTNVGTLIEKDGKQYVKLKCYPLPNEQGEVFLSVFEQRNQTSSNQSGASGGSSSDQYGGASTNNGQGGGGGQGGGALEDSIPFARVPGIV